MKILFKIILLFTPASAFAAVPAEAISLLSEALADGLTVAGLSLIVVVGIAAFKYLRLGVVGTSDYQKATRLKAEEQVRDFYGTKN